MPIYQNSTITSTKLVIGNYKIETAPSVAGTYVNLGAGMVSSFGHNITKFDVQAGNAPDPIEGVADEEFRIEFEMIEFNGSVLSAIQGGAISHSLVTGSAMTINGGGNTTITPRAFRLTNTRMISGTTTQTIIKVYKATMENGIQFTAKSDNDADPIMVMPGTIVAKNDTTLSAGSQLFTLFHRRA